MAAEQTTMFLGRWTGILTVAGEVAGDSEPAHRARAITLSGLNSPAKKRTISRLKLSRILFRLALMLDGFSWTPSLVATVTCETHCCISKTGPVECCGLQNRGYQAAMYG